MEPTKLDSWEPQGIPIHPLDFLELLCKVQREDNTDVTVVCEKSPSPVDEADYKRNLHKIGTIVGLDGHTYFETLSIEPKPETTVSEQVRQNYLLLRKRVG